MDETLESKLVAQVKVLGDTVTAMVERLDMALKTMAESQKINLAAAELLKETADTLQLTNEALLKSLNESDGQLDDLAAITAALLTIQKQQEALAANAS